MPTLFTQIIDGEIPGNFVWRDERCVAFLTIAPHTPGHTLVVPRAETANWTDMPDDLAAHLMLVAKTIGQALAAEWDAPRSGLVIAGFEIPHTHLHVLPIWHESDLGFDHAQTQVPPSELAANAERIRARLRAEGHGEHADAAT